MSASASRASSSVFAQSCDLSSAPREICAETSTIRRRMDSSFTIAPYSPAFAHTGVFCAHPDKYTGISLTRLEAHSTASTTVTRSTRRFWFAKPRIALNAARACGCVKSCSHKPSSASSAFGFFRHAPISESSASLFASPLAAISSAFMRHLLAQPLLWPDFWPIVLALLPRLRLALVLSGIRLCPLQCVDTALGPASQQFSQVRFRPVRLRHVG